MMKPVIWLAEDESSIADTLLYALETEGFSVNWFERGEPLLVQLQHSQPALIILDVGLPDINGFELCKRILAVHEDIPVIFLTARSEELDRIVGLEIGADDYIPKPFSPREVCARVRTVLRRLEKQKRQLGNEMGLFILDEPGANIHYCQQPLTLTRYEYLLLKTLLKAPGRVFSRQLLMDMVWSEAEESLERTVDTHIKTLRAKLRAVNPDANPIQTHRGMGYSLSNKS